jgi:hypothetical protein
MKAAFEKALNVIGGYAARGNLRRQGTTEGATGESTGNEEYQLQPSVIVEQDVEDPALSALMSSGGSAAMEGGDDVLFSKNNVLLKHPNPGESEDCVLHSATHDSDQASPLSVPKGSLDNHVLVPGFLFITTRGSNFGTTLILNWAPNSSMIVPKSDHSLADSQGVEASPAESSSSESSSSSHGHRYSSISINLCTMEMIRVFYRMDDSGFIISGELVVKSKEENFKVCLAISTGLNLHTSVHAGLNTSWSVQG